ncbi:hypothetical protein MSIMFI_04439 [Mycobacterium simulans]|uniref:DUF732 domain-containing protein n=1 Tax=Mycobacterium simulans TaxID=627089 RepID=UPI0019BAE99C|nr:DUF732 domain-containing protein [Mycobacterium simulans]SON62909.1 hypothetical protein MSIMFI_04439 [Mycobacterium simulans]
MFTGTATRAGAVATVTVIGIGAAILRGSTAVADPNQDDQFLASLDQHGIPALENAPSLIAVAHQVCGRLDGGMPVNGVVEAMTTFAYDNDPSMRQYPRDRLTRTFSRFVSASVQVYCPFHQDKLASFSAIAAPGSHQSTHRVATYTHHATTSECDLRISMPTAWPERTPTRVARRPHPIVGGVFVASHNWGDRSDCTAHSDVLAPPIETIPAGETIAPKPPQVPAPLPPPANILIPPRAPAPSQPPRQTPPLPQQPPPPPQEPPPPPQQLPPQPQESPPPPQQPPPPQGLPRLPLSRGVLPVVAVSVMAEPAAAAPAAAVAAVAVLAAVAGRRSRRRRDPCRRASSRSHRETEPSRRSAAADGDLTDHRLDAVPRRRRCAASTSAFASVCA